MLATEPLVRILRIYGAFMRVLAAIIEEPLAFERFKRDSRYPPESKLMLRPPSRPRALVAAAKTPALESAL